jgi:hypothetical protein
MGTLFYNCYTTLSLFLCASGFFRLGKVRQHYNFCFGIKSYLHRLAAEAHVLLESSLFLKNIPENHSGASAAVLPATTRTTGLTPGSVTSGTLEVRARNRSCSSTTKILAERSVFATTRRGSSSGMRPSSATG